MSPRTGECMAITKPKAPLPGESSAKTRHCRLCRAIRASGVVLLRLQAGRSLIGRQRQLYIGGAKPPTDWNKFGLCINYPVQASCADVFKLAMIKLDSVFRAKSLDATIVLTVHDELLIECDEKIAEQVRLLAQQIMESAFTTIFGEANPCDVKAKICSDWSEKID